jgi:toxin-antitoxin system PIN domain toxin
MPSASPSLWTTTMFLPDINLWLALAFESHVHHGRAKKWFESRSNDGCCFCRATQQGFLRLVTNPKAFGAEAVTLSDAWRMYDEFFVDSRVSFSDEPPNVEKHWRAYTMRETFSPKVWNDAFLAALAMTAGFDLVTFDKGFAQYAGLRFTIL